MRAFIWALTVATVTMHGLIHLLGAAKGLGWADVAELTTPVSPAMGAAWLAAAALVLAAGAVMALRARRWWIVAAVAALASQAVILTAWSDAAAGTAANAVLLIAAGYGYASRGPRSYRAEYHRRVATALAQPLEQRVVTDMDLDGLPEPVAAYIRQSGAVGQPRITSFRARLHGRIRDAEDKPWMRFTAEQVNTYGPEPTRLFFMDMDATAGMPVDVLHAFVGPHATMRAKACSIVTVVDVAGAGMDRAETVTLLNDMCIFAPAALIDAPITWQPLDGNRARAAYTKGEHTVTAELIFNDDHELVDFISDDRGATPDGKAFAQRRWSTPLGDHRTMGTYRMPAGGEARWHAAGQEGEYAYIEFRVDDITFNITEQGTPHRAPARQPA
jgi:hypothetical protein